MASLVKSFTSALNRINKIFAQEAPLYSKHLGVAGRVDCVGLV